MDPALLLLLLIDETPAALLNPPGPATTLAVTLTVTDRVDAALTVTTLDALTLTVTNVTDASLTLALEAAP